MSQRFLAGAALLVLSVALLLYAGCGEGGPTPIVWTDVNTPTELRAAVEAARGTPVIVDFWGDWCTNCGRYDRLESASSRLNAALHRAVRLRVDLSGRDKIRHDMRAAVGEEFVGAPYFAFFDREGKLRRDLAVVGWHGEEGSVSQLVNSLERAANP